ncbi:YrhK family protein [Nocardioides panacisoli]|uniref:YrhK family protein n=1 Tax=Nocardioides panacisoli TaxID=627624 RepID=UPI001C62D6F3|nr:YrhK family protein [Nocardioides panacisoli]QYJ05425.1 YrhK family protein [Nocardioides panacisoli]
MTTSRNLSTSIPLGPERLVIDRRYETLSIANDFLIGLWFLVGSVLFYFKAVETSAITCFVVGSAQFLVRPGIRLGRRVHLRRRGLDDPRDPSGDY